jgi:hypothetical protein
VGRRAATRYGGDVLILTQHGTVMLSDLLKSTKVNPTEENSGKYIQQLVSSAVSETGDKFGWEPFLFPGANMFIINIPATDTTAYQFVQNDITKAWSEFLGYEANAWELHKQLPVYGSFNAVYRAWEGHLDGSVLDAEGRVDVPGVDVRFEAQTSFTVFNNQVVNKHFKMVRPAFLSSGKFSVSVACNVDYSFQSPSYPVSFSPYKPGRWDEDYWEDSRWAGGLLSYIEWTTVLGIGFAGSLRILGLSISETYWATTDWLFEPGGVM